MNYLHFHIYMFNIIIYNLFNFHYKYSKNIRYYLILYIRILLYILHILLDYLYNLHLQYLLNMYLNNLNIIIMLYRLQVHLYMFYLYMNHPKNILFNLYLIHIPIMYILYNHLTYLYNHHHLLLYILIIYLFPLYNIHYELNNLLVIIHMIILQYIFMYPKNMVITINLFYILLMLYKHHRLKLCRYIFHHHLYIKVLFLNTLYVFSLNKLYNH